MAGLEGLFNKKHSRREALIKGGKAIAGVAGAAALTGCATSPREAAANLHIVPPAVEINKPADKALKSMASDLVGDMIEMNGDNLKSTVHELAGEGCSLGTKHRVVIDRERGSLRIEAVAPGGGQPPVDKDVYTGQQNECGHNISDLGTFIVIDFKLDKGDPLTTPSASIEPDDVLRALADKHTKAIGFDARYQSEQGPVDVSATAGGDASSVIIKINNKNNKRSHPGNQSELNGRVGDALSHAMAAYEEVRR